MQTNWKLTELGSMLGLLTVLAWWPTSLLAQSPATSEAFLPQSCIAVFDEHAFLASRGSIVGKGNYCVVQDFVQREVRDWVNGGDIIGSPNQQGQDGVVGLVPSGSVSLDLQGHLLTGKPFLNTNGVVASIRTALFDEPNGGIRIKMPGINVTVRNGVVDVPGPLSYGVVVSPFKTPFWSGSNAVKPVVYRTVDPEDDPPYSLDSVRNGIRLPDSVIWDYNPATHYVVENLEIYSGGRGVIMSGADNVLRNNVINVDSPTAVYMYGPRPVIEGNTFIIKLDPKNGAPLPAVIKLRDAHGAIIRNNHFVIKRSFFDKPDNGEHFAVNLLESKDVVIQDNQIHDELLLVRKDAASNTVETGNVLNSKAPAPMKADIHTVTPEVEAEQRKRWQEEKDRVRKCLDQVGPCCYWSCR